MGLPGVQTLGCAEVFQIRMVGPDQEGHCQSLQQMVPFLDRELEPQQLLVPDGIIPFYRQERAREKRHRSVPYCRLRTARAQDRGCGKLGS